MNLYFTLKIFYLFQYYYGQQNKKYTILVSVNRLKTHSMLKSKSTNILPISITTTTQMRTPAILGGQFKQEMIQYKIIKQNPQKVQRYNSGTKQNQIKQKTKEKLITNNNCKQEKQQTSNYISSKESKLNSDLSKIKGKYLGNTNRSYKNIKKKQYEIAGQKLQKSAQKNKKQKINEKSIQKHKRYNYKGLICKQNEAVQIEINIRQDIPQCHKNKGMDNNQSIINHLYAQSPSKHESPLKNKMEIYQRSNVYLNKLHRYESENKLKKYDYMTGLTHKNYENEQCVKSRKIVYPGLDENTAGVERDRSVNQYKNSLSSLKYHYYIDPNVVHKPSPATSRLKNKSNSKNHSTSTAEFRKVLNYPQKYQRMAKQRQRNANSISRIQCNQRQIQNQVHKLGQKCRNMLSSLHQYETPPKFNKIQVYDERKDQQLRLFQINLQQKQQQRIIEEEKEIRRKQLQNKIKIEQENQRQILMNIEIQKERKREMQQTINKRRYSQMKYQHELQQIPISNRLNEDKYKETRGYNKNYKYSINAEQQCKNKLKEYKPGSNFKSLDHRTAATDIYQNLDRQQYNEKQVIRNKTKHYESVTEFDINNRLNGGINKSQCNCNHLCSCVDKAAVDLNTSRLQRINNKLESYIVKNIDKGSRQPTRKTATKNNYYY